MTVEVDRVIMSPFTNVNSIHIVKQIIILLNRILFRKKLYNSVYRVIENKIMFLYYIIFKNNKI